MPAAAIRKLAQERTASSVTIIFQCFVDDDVSVVKNRLHCDFYLDFAVGVVKSFQLLLLLFMLMLLKVTTLEAEVKLCTSTVEGLAFLLWRHLEHFLLYTRLACAEILLLT